MVFAGLRVGLLVALVCVLGAASLAAAFQIQKRVVEKGAADNTIGIISFEPSPEDSLGQRAGKLVLVTARRGSHHEATIALMDEIRRYCPDERGHSVWGSEPSEHVDPEDWDKPSLPPGTRFSESFRCEAPLPNEIAIAAAATQAEAEARVMRALSDRDGGASDHLTALSGSYTDKHPKYPTVDRIIGGQIRRYASQHCPEGHVVLGEVVVGTYPPPVSEQATVASYSRLVVGTALSCLERRDANPVARAHTLPAQGS